MRGGNVWLAVFAIAFAATAIAEWLQPAHSLAGSTPRRWTSNSILVVVSSAAVLVAYQLSGIALASEVTAASRGLLNRFPIAYWERFAIGFAVLDLAAYGAHRMFHALGPLWRVHRVHHSETDLDLTTGLRFHPVEALFQQGLLLAVIALLGIPPAAVALVALAVVVQDFFTHANVRLAQRFDRWLRLLIITPAMHRVHHSQGIPEQNTNFGTIFSLWDRMFGSYGAAIPPDKGAARFGLREMAEGSDLSAAGLLLLPFRRQEKKTTASS